MIRTHADTLNTPLTTENAAARTRLRADVLVLAVSLLLYSLVASQMAPFIPDDSFITYRYAENLAAGNGLRFNPADAPVEGYSNFLWLAGLAGLRALGGDLVSGGVWAGAVLGAVGVALLWLILRRRGRSGWALAVPVGLLSLSGPLVLYAVSGMETALFAALLLAAVLVADSLTSRPRLVSGLALGAIGVLLALTRPEGIVAFPVVAVGLLLLGWRDEAARRRALLRALIAGALLFVAALAAYHVVRVVYFGALLPTPFLSKGAAGGAFFESWRINLRQFFVRQTHYYTPMAYYYLAIGVPAALAVALSVRQLGRLRTEVIALALALVYAAIYLNFVDWMPGMRYYAPLVGLLLIPFSLLADELRGAVSGWRANLGFLLLGGLLVLASGFGLATLRLDSQQLQAATEESLVALGHWLRDTQPAGAVLAMGDVGATPYYSGLRTVDINPNSLTDRTIAAEGWSADYFFAVDPDIVVLTAFSLTAPDFTREHEELYALPRFQDTYERVGVSRNDWYQDRSYWVFLRRGVELTPAQLEAFPGGIRKQ